VRIDVATLEAGQVVRAALSETIDSRTEDVLFDAPVVGDVEISRDRTTVSLKGMVESSTPLSCGRCLTPFRLPLRAYLNEEFLLDSGGSVRQEQQELKDEDFIHPLGPELILDVSEVIRQQLLLGLPMIPLCRPDCRGLCPRCGANWNETTCSHQVADVDPRLAPLLQLRDRFPKE
jgi:uncharacterized protein